MLEGSRLSIIWQRLSRQFGVQGLVRNNALMFAASLGAGFFSYVFHFALGRLLGPATYSVVAAAVSAVYLLTLPSLVIQLVSARFTSVATAQHEHFALSPLARMLTVVSLVIGGIAGLLVWLLHDPIAGFLQLPDQRIVGVLALSTLLGMLVSTNRGILQGLRRFGWLALNLVIDAFGKVVVAVGLVLLGLGATGAVLGVMAGPAIAYLQSLPSIVRLPRGKPAQAVAGREVALYAAPTVAAVVGVTYLFNIDIVLARHYLPAHAAGIYAAGAVLARALYFIGTTVSAVMFPEVAGRHARDEAHFHVVDLSLLFLAAVDGVLLLVYWLVPGLVLLPYGSQFADVRPYLAAFAAALGLLTVSNLFVNYFLSVFSTRFAAPLLATGVLETVLMVLFHHDLGQLLAVLVTSNVGLAAALGALYLFERRRERVI